MLPAIVERKQGIAACGLALACVLSMTGCSSSVSWDEEVRTHDGRMLQVSRKSVFSADEWGRTGRGGRSSHTIAFRHGEKEVVWNHDALSIVNPLPHILDVVDGDPVVVLPVTDYYYCRHYDFPPEGLVAMRYREGRWERTPLVALPAKLAVNLLRSEAGIRHHHRERFAGKLVRIEDKRLLESGFIVPKAGATLDEMSRYYSKVRGACVRMRPPPDPVRDAARERLLEARRSARSVTATLERVETGALRVTGAAFAASHGSWTGSTWLNACAGLVSDVEQLNVIRDRPGGGYDQTISGYQVNLVDPNARPRELQFARQMGGPSLERVFCSGGNVYVVLRMRSDALLVHRLAASGHLADTATVLLPGTSAFERGWGHLWDASVTADGELSVTLAEYEYPVTMGRGGTLHRRQHYRARLF